MHPSRLTEAQEHEPFDLGIFIGQIEHDCRQAIRDLVSVNGREKAREQVFIYLDDALSGRRRK